MHGTSTMHEPELKNLLESSKAIATQAGLRLINSFGQEQKNYVHCVDHPKEIKALADTVLEKDILKGLVPFGLPILSEESGFIHGQQESKYWFVVDPLDGTFNFVKGLGPSAVSIAFWQDERPVFGVIYSLLDRQLFWGGNGMGSYKDGERISVSGTVNRAQASICTGFPVRFDFENDMSMRNFGRVFSAYAKIRMLGSAAVSLLHVAKGSSDVYLEENIMLWDVAAGLAIVEGAGGAFLMKETDKDWCYKVSAANGHILPSFINPLPGLG